MSVSMLAMVMTAQSQEAKIEVHADQVSHRLSRYLTGACIEDVNHEIYGGLYSQMIFGESFQEPAPAIPPRGFTAFGGAWSVDGAGELSAGGGEGPKLMVKTNDVLKPLPFVSAASEETEISGMWRGVRRGSAIGKYDLETTGAFTGNQSQRLRLMTREGEIGIENQGLNRWGLNWVADKPYEGCVWVRAEQAADLFASLESRDGSRLDAEARLKVVPGDWQRLEFTLTPKQADTAGRFVLKLKQPGSVLFGHVFLQPGEWGRFKGLPVRRDVAVALIDQGVTVLRYGGSMVNHAEYRWKKMIGPRDRRPPCRGTWYPQSSNGWGIVDFMDFCRAAGFLGIPAFNMGETAGDMADFIEYMNGPAESAWGAKRTADGHPAPYNLRYLELGNEERVDELYFQKFKPLAEAIWAKDPNVTLVVGDFAYGQPILDPDRLTGAASGITNLNGQRKILALAKQHEREVWFDLHVGTDGPRPDSSFAGMLSFIDALAGIAQGARHKVVVFEFNAGNHAQRRALANALAINAIARDGRIPIATSANGLQPDGQNDNGWDQGLLFLNPSQVWLQPPGYVTRMISRHYQPLLVKCSAHSPSDVLDVAALRDEEGRHLVLQVVNVSDQPVASSIRLTGFAPSQPVAVVEKLSGALDAVNTANRPGHIVPQRTEWTHALDQGAARYTFAPHSFTILRFE